VFVVLDGLSPRHANPSIMPNLCRLAKGTGSRPSLGLASLLAVTSPAMASFVTGEAPFEHGVLTDAPVDLGDGSGHAWPWPMWRGRRTVFEACRAAGRRTLAVLASPALIAVSGADRADLHWPFDRYPPGGIALDARGHATDAVVVAQFLEATSEADLPEMALVHLKGPDTAGHVCGPDSPDAFVAYRRTDHALAELMAVYRPVWDRTVVVAVSDHGQENVLVPEPVDLQPVLDREGLPWTVHAEGSGALAVWTGEGRSDSLAFTRLAGVEGDIAWSPSVRLLWAGLGRYFGRVGDPVPAGVHGGPRSVGQVVVVGGGHPAARAMAAVIERSPVPATAWASAIAGWLGLDDFPVHRGRPAGAGPPVGASRGTGREGLDRVRDPLPAG
jgi:hypothetical protein